jgi:hypothetical protein
VLRAAPPGDWRLDPVAYATAATEIRVFSSEHATVGELHLPDADLPARMATRTSLLMPVSAPIAVELLRNVRYEKCVMKPGAFCIAPVGPMPAARWHGQRSILVLELSPWLLNSVAEANDVLRIELQAGSAVDDPQIAYLLFALRADLANSSPSGRASLLRAHLLENRASFRQIGGAQSLGESAVNLIQQVARFAVLALIPPQTSQAHSRAQLKGKCPVPPCCFQGLLEAGIHFLERLGTGLHQYVAS